MSPDPVFRAVADPTRRAILDGLRGGPRTAGGIAEDFPISRPAVSKHLRILEAARLVRAEKVGRERRFRLDPRPLGEIDRWLERHRTHLAASLARLKEHVERPGPSGSASQEESPDQARRGPNQQEQTDA